MEIPKIYREQPTRIRFEGSVKEYRDKGSGQVYYFFKYPGGEIPYLNGEDFLGRLIDRGFGEREIDKIISLFISTIATEATIPSSKVSESVF